MKKIVLTMAMLLALNVTAMAEARNSDEINAIEAYDIDVNISSLARYLELSGEQVEYVNVVHRIFSENMKGAAESKNEETRKKLVKNTVDYALRHMSQILSEKQYRKYVTILNVTLNNRGIECK